MREASSLGSLGLLLLAAACGARPSPPDSVLITPRFEPAPSKETIAREPEVRRVGSRAIPSVAFLHTSLGRITCDLFYDRAPKTVENFVGLATGTKPWKDPKTEDWVERPAYVGTIFHRVIPGFIIQAGDIKGDGTGDPGFVFEDEIWPGAEHDRAGLLCMANRGKDTNGMQFFITDGPAPHLDTSYTIFGECRELDRIHAIASVPRQGERPRENVEILAIDFE